MVAAVREGQSQRQVAAGFRVALSTLQWWIRRAQGNPLDQVDWHNQSRAPHRVANRTPASVEVAILDLRRQLREASALGFEGALAIQDQWRVDHPGEKIPSLRTIGRILERHGVLDGRRRVRHAAPPPGWYLPEVALRKAELESFDVIEGLVIEGHGEHEVFTGKALWGPSAAAWPMRSVTAKAAVDKLLTHWRTQGLPDYVQFDNDTRFQGGHNHPDVVGRIARVCLSLGVTPVFVPPRESGFQAVIESFNGLWEAKVWERFHHLDLSMLEARSNLFLTAYINRLAQRAEHVPPRKSFPAGWRLNLQAHPTGRVIYLRRSNAGGIVSLLGRCFTIDALPPYRLVRCEVHLTENQIRFYRLRRREPDQQPLLATTEYRLPQRRFIE